jgi:hypothetical protein
MWLVSPTEAFKIDALTPEYLSGVFMTDKVSLMLVATSNAAVKSQ